MQHTKEYLNHEMRLNFQEEVIEIKVFKFETFITKVVFILKNCKVINIIFNQLKVEIWWVLFEMKKEQRDQEFKAYVSFVHCVVNGVLEINFVNKDFYVWIDDPRVDKLQRLSKQLKDWRLRDKDNSLRSDTFWFLSYQKVVKY